MKLCVISKALSETFHVNSLKQSFLKVHWCQEVFCKRKNVSLEEVRLNSRQVGQQERALVLDMTSYLTPCDG